VAGVPLSVVEERVRTFLARFSSTPAFVITPLIHVFVGGEVRQPNVYAVPPGTTIAQAVALAGGPTERGRLDRVRILRQPDPRLIDLLRPDAQTAQAEVRSGDQILVDRRRSFFQDYLAPASSVVAAAAAITSIIVQVSRKP
jgi:protein involved in polysaccharide export with SLBB domain